MKITAHTLVKNEARWIWFALQSVLPYVDEILVWDTGSTDITPDIVKSIKNPKIKFKQIGSVDANGHTQARQAMLDQTDSDWILILDGDEIWWWQSIKALVDEAIKHSQVASFISPFINCVGDVFHLQPWSQSHYAIGRLHGAYSFRLINRQTPGLHLGSNPHGRQEYRTGQNLALQNIPVDKLPLVDWPYLHLTHLPRSIDRHQDQTTLKRGFKYRYELGVKPPKGFTLPEAFYLPRPEIVPDPFFHRGMGYVVKSIIYEPIRKIKNLIKSKPNYGY